MPKLNSSNQIFMLCVLAANLAWHPSAFCANPISQADLSQGSNVKKGFEQIQKGQYSQAVKTLCLAVQVERNNVEARRYLALALIKSGSNKTALEQLDLIGKMISPSAFDYYLYGEAYFGLDEIAPARDAYQKAVSLSPNYDAARGGLIKALVKLDEFDLAKQVCLDGLKQAKTAATKQYYQTLFEGVQEVSLKPSSDKSLHFEQDSNVGTAPLSLGRHSSE